MDRTYTCSSLRKESSTRRVVTRIKSDLDACAFADVTDIRSMVIDALDVASGQRLTEDQQACF